MEHRLPVRYRIACHTKDVTPGATFVAIQGMSANGVDFIEEAIKKGAIRVVIEQSVQLSAETLQKIQNEMVQLVRVSNTRKSLAEFSAHSYEYSIKKLQIIGVTGTKGKSTVSFLLAHIFASAGYKTALLSTVYNCIKSVRYATELTTQQPDYLHAFFYQCVQENIDVVIMEVAAQAMTLHRVDGIPFSMVVLLNFSHEHGEFYPTMDDYFFAKTSLISLIKPGGKIIINQDSAELMKCTQQRNDAILFSTRYHRDATSHPVRGITFCFNDKEYRCPALLGDFNRENIQAAICVAHQWGIDDAILSRALLTFPGVPGRLEKYLLINGATAYIDYAHNPSSFEHIFKTMRPLTEQLIVLFGCGGDRDVKKRPIMGLLASKYADHVIITEDNPRSEQLASIIRDIVIDIPDEYSNKIIIEHDREKAINIAYTMSKKDAIILLLGKGPDEYQLINNKKITFSEKSILSQWKLPDLSMFE